MRNNTDIRVSLIIPTRDRLELLRRNLPTFYNLAKCPHQVETIVVTDLDDPGNHDIFHLLMQFPNTFLISQHRTRCLIKDYNNRGSQLSTGKYIWILNDECEMTTHHWDEVLSNRVEHFLTDKPDRITYVAINDDTHYNAGVQHVSGCCFPVLSREAVDCINGIMPPEINAHGADFAIYNIFQSLCKNRILNCHEVVLIDHSSNNHFGTYRNKRKNPDTTQKNIDSMSAVDKLNNEQTNNYINLINKEINKHI